MSLNHIDLLMYDIIKFHGTIKTLFCTGHITAQNCKMRLKLKKILEKVQVMTALLMLYELEFFAALSVFKDV